MCDHRGSSHRQQTEVSEMVQAEGQRYWELDGNGVVPVAPELSAQSKVEEEGLSTPHSKDGVCQQ